MSTQPDARRSEPVHVEWVGSIGRITIDGVLRAAVEWSETRQAWCIEDAEAHCLGHRDHIHGKEADIQSGGRYGSIFLAPREAERRLQRAREILQLLKPEDQR